MIAVMINSLSAGPGLEVPAGSAEGAPVGPVGESPLMLLGPTSHLGELKWEIVAIPDVEKKGKDRSLVGADGLFVERDGVFGAEVVGESLKLNKTRDDVETLGEDSPGLGG